MAGAPGLSGCAATFAARAPELALRLAALAAALLAATTAAAAASEGLDFADGRVHRLDVGRMMRPVGAGLLRGILLGLEQFLEPWHRVGAGGVET